MAITFSIAKTDPIPDAPKLEMEIRAILASWAPGCSWEWRIPSSSGHRENLRLIEERRRGTH